MYLGFICSFFVAISSSIPVVIGAYSVDAIIKDFRGQETLPKNLALFSVLGILVAVFLRFLFEHMRVRLQESIAYKVTAQERLTIGEILKRVPLGYFEQNKTGDITSIITTELTMLELQMTRMVDKIIGGYVMTLAMLLWLLIFNIKAALVGIFAVFISLLILIVINKFSQKAFSDIHKCNKEMINRVLEYIKGMAQIKSYGNESKAINSINDIFNKTKDKNIANEIKYAPINAMHQLCLKLGVCGIIYVVTELSLENEITIGFSILLLMFSFLIFSHVEGINSAAVVMGIIDSNINNLNRLKKVKFIDNNGQNIHLEKFDIEFNNVSFAYDSENVINNLSFKVLEGTTTALVGYSGSGKSTLCHLIARFYDAQEGDIIIGGHKIKEFTCDSLLSQISMVFQNVYLFNDTIKNNIHFGNPLASEDQIVKVAKRAKCHEFISKLPEGYDTVVGESGATLSGGEKQRISIARALLKDAPIIMLDEATASIDPENEDYIQAAINELTRNKTVVIIAHKLSTIQNADQIIVLKEGRILERGKHKELLKNDGLYKKFIDMKESSENWYI
jgi:ATP-binding cassette subfamily B protein